MSNPKSIHGVSNTEDLDSSLTSRDVRPLKYKISEFISENGPFAVILFGVFVALIPFINMPQISDVLLVPGLILAYLSNKLKAKPIFRKPTNSIKNDRDGFLYLGNTKDTNAEIWFSADDIKRHMLVFGSTGSGKTRFLLGIVYQAILMGSSAMIVDGKADNTVYWLLYSICRKLQVEDNLLVLNYIIGDKDDQVRKYELSRTSNTTNPFAVGSSEQLRSLIVGLMRESSDGMWKGRASSMMAALLKALVYLRNTGYITMDIGTIRETMTLDKLVELMGNPELSKEAVNAIKSYLLELPTFTEEDAFMGQIESKAYEQHGYLQIQLTEVMSDLSETYGHIFNVPKGEIDFADVIFNRRILFVMLPSIEKDPDALAGLGKLVVSGIKSSLAVALGYNVEGTKTSVLDTKPSNADVPFFILLDEYGFYAVEGFAVVAAQARSLGVCVGYFGQDFTSFKRGSEIEASQTEANTNIKIFMKIEETKDTVEIAERRGGEANISNVSGYEIKGSSSGFNGQPSAQILKVKRINLRDLVSQDQGEAHIIYGDTLARCRLFYADPVQMDLSYLNKFVMVEPPKQNIIDSINGLFDKLEKFFSLNEKKDDLPEKPAIIDDGVKNLINDYNLSLSKKESSSDAAITAVGLISVRESIKDAEMEAKSNPSDKGSPVVNLKKDDDKKINLNKDIDDVFGGPIDDFESQFDKLNLPSEENDLPDDMDGGIDFAPNFNEDDYQEALDILGDENKPTETIMDEAKTASEDFEGILNSMVFTSSRKTNTAPLTAAEAIRLSPINQLVSIEKRFGETDDAAIKNAKRDMDILSEKVVYPVNPTPNKATINEMDDRFVSIMKQINAKGKNNK
jgi:intracellular multiplication protein IcmO